MYHKPSGGHTRPLCLLALNIWHRHREQQIVRGAHTDARIPPVGNFFLSTGIFFSLGMRLDGPWKRGRWRQQIPLLVLLLVLLLKQKSVCPGLQVSFLFLQTRLYLPIPLLQLGIYLFLLFLQVGRKSCHGLFSSNQLRFACL